MSLNLILRQQSLIRIWIKEGPSNNNQVRLPIQTIFHHTHEDESNHSIAWSFDEPSSENQDSESDHNYVNATTELNHNEYIKPSASVKESYYNIFECGRSVLDKLDVTYQKAFTASEKPAPSAPPEEPPVDWNTQ